MQTEQPIRGSPKEYSVFHHNRLRLSAFFSQLAYMKTIRDNGRNITTYSYDMPKEYTVCLNEVRYPPLYHFCMFLYKQCL